MSGTAIHIPENTRIIDFSSRLVAIPFRMGHLFMQSTPILFVAALGTMLFRPPDLATFAWDRVALAILIFAAGLRMILTHEPFRLYAATWPLLGLTILSASTVLGKTYVATDWSLLAARWIVPLVLFQLAGFVFRSDAARGLLELFCLGSLLYLSLISVLQLFGAPSFIYPRFILDENIGIHADRARGPFLQAVANGVSLTLLGLAALDSFRRRHLSAWFSAILLVTVPLALLATRTRAVWISGLLSIAALALFSARGRLRNAARVLCILTVVLGAAAWLYQSHSDSFSERLADRSPVDFRLGMYRAGWEMFAEKPLAGWGSDDLVQAEVARHVSDFRPDYYVFHNTYLDLAVRHGLLGLALYVWLFICLFRLSKSFGQNTDRFADRAFRAMWPLMIVTYLLNASAVVMNYQFVNGLLFTFAGILAAADPRKAESRAETYPWR